MNIISNSKAIPDIKSECAKNINGYPTIVEVIPGGKLGMEHEGDRSTKELMTTIKQIMKNIILIMIIIKRSIIKRSIIKRSIIK